MIINPFSKNDIKMILRSLKYIKNYKLRIALIIVCMICGIVFSLIQPIIWANLIGSLFKNDFKQVILLVLYTAILFIVSSCINVIQDYMSIFINNNIIYDIKKDIYKSTLDLSIKAFDKMSVGDFISRIHNDSQTIASVLTNQLVVSIIDVIKVIVIGIAIFSISPILSLIVLVCFPVSYLIFIHYGEKLKKKNGELVKVNDYYFNELHQSLIGIREINTLNIKKIKLSLFSTLTEKIKDKTINLGFTGTISQVISQSVSLISEILVLTAGVYMIYRNKITVVYFITFSSYSSQFSSSLLSITKINSNLQQILKSLERVYNLIDSLSYSKQEFGEKILRNINGEICFNNVMFEYNENLPILKNISFNIPSNKVTAIVGSSGSGKSTILNLILRFYDPKKGSIELDGININELDENTLRSSISIVHQSPYLFNASIKDNLLLANPRATDEEIENACLKAYIHDYIMSLPQKYESLIGENGINLSGGQKQRLAIARSILKKSKIMLFDEATASLDNESQRYINKSIRELSLNCTVVLIAHRLSTFIGADKIIVIDKGKVRGTGTHNELINSNEIYACLYKTSISELVSC